MEALRLITFASILMGALGVPILESTPEDYENRVSAYSDVGHRLPYTVEPLEYEITLKPNLTELIFDGEVSILFNVEEVGLKYIIMHSRVNLISASVDNIEVLWSITDNTYFFATFNVTALNLAVGNHIMKIIFEGDIQTDMSGFYISSYKEAGEEVLLASTQFQPVFARKAFPCFDEPKFKARFSINIDCPENYTCLSNMKVDEQKSLTTGLTSFRKTPLISTYLIAFIVSQFVPAEQTEDGNFGIWARPEASEQGKYAFDIGQKITDHLIDYYDIPYYEPDGMKMDHAAIPDFSAGAMENWGLVTYREAYLMMEEEETATRFKQFIATILTHEIVHMWFGNMVTCHWWSDIWLNEAFASYFQYMATDVVDPRFGLEDQFIILQIQAAFFADGTVTSAPLTDTNVNSPVEISAHFSTISYQKGASVLRMMRNLLGDEPFRLGLSEHLKNKIYDIVEPNDLFEALEKHADLTKYNKTVKDIMEPWTAQSGFPVVSVKIVDDVVHLSQERFGRRGEERPDTLYHIPISYATEKDLNKKDIEFIMDGKTHEFSIPTLEDDEWVIFNIHSTGYYRILYDDYEPVIRALNGPSSAHIHRYNKGQIVDDAFNFAREGYIEYSDLLDIILFLKNETDYVPWQAAYAGLNFVRLQFGKVDDLLPVFDSHIHYLMTNVTAALGLEAGGDYLEQRFRGSTLVLACEIGDEDCIESSMEKFESLKVNGTWIHPDIRDAVYCAALRNGTGSDYDFLWKKHDESNVVTEKVLILGALGCTRDQEKVMHYLMATLNLDSGIRDQDRALAFNSALNSNPENAATTFEFLKNNIEDIRIRYIGGVSTVASSLAGRMNEDQLDELLAWSTASTVLTADEKSTITSAVAAGKANIEWAEGKKKEVLDWISDYNSSTMTTSTIFLLLSALALLFFNR